MAMTTLRSKVMTITPDQATAWLEGKAANRNIRQSKVLEFAADMVAGRWQVTHQGIAFDQDDKLIDGQHRLWAIVESNRATDMMVTWGLRSEDILVIDSGLSRNIVDCIRLNDPAAGVGSLHVATARAMLQSIFGQARTHANTRQEVKAFLDKHDKAINFAVAAFGSKKKPGITIAPLLASVARAYYSQNHEKLQRFAEVMVSGIAEPATEIAAIKLREWMLQVKGGRARLGFTRTGLSGAAVFYGKSERGLMAYLRGEKIGNLYPASEELFPLPEEIPRKRKATPKALAAGRKSHVNA